MYYLNKNRSLKTVYFCVLYVLNTRLLSCIILVTKELAGGEYMIRTFLIKDIDYKIVVEPSTRKEILSYLDEYLEYDFFDPSDDSFAILYKDGSEDYINADYDSHKIRRQHIASMVYTNSYSDIVYGNFEMNP